jgi:REP element-mobilizing transposase RayT
LELPARRPIRLKPFNYLGQKSYFVTICCFQRRSLFLDAQLAAWLVAVLRSECAAKSFRIHAYCLMPDHLHFLAEGAEPASDLLDFVKSLKIKSSRRYFSQTAGILWQKRFYEHILRATESLEVVAWYTG